MTGELRHPHRVTQASAVMFAIIAILHGSAFARVNWGLKSSTTGDLPAPNEGNEQTCCVVRDIDKDGDGDLDTLLKPCHHKAPRIDILLNAGPRKMSLDTRN